MMVTNAESAGKRHFSDVHYRRTSLTPGRHATTTTTNMDQKELEDRLAAAEALSSLGLPTFRDSNPVAPVDSVPSSVPKVEKASKARGKARAGRGREEHGTGRETKSRSARGRGTKAGKVVQDNVESMTTNPAVSTPSALTAIPEVRSEQNLLQQLTTPRTSSSRGGGGGRGSGRGSRGTRGGGNNKAGTTKSTPPAVVVVPASDGDVVSVAGGGVGVGVGVGASADTAGTATQRGASRGGQRTVLPSAALSAGSVVHHHHAADATSSPTAVSVPRLVLTGGNTIVLSTPSTFPSTASSSLLSSSLTSPSSSTAAAVAATTTAPVMLSSGSALYQKSTPIPIKQVTSSAVAPGTPVDNLSSQPGLPSLSLPSFSLGSTGLPNLPSIPNLPSLPSAISSLQLGALEGSSVSCKVESHDSSPVSQLSPRSRDGDEKSLPLKKRRIIESSASSSSQPGPMSPMPMSPLVTSPAGAATPTHAVASTSLAAPSKSPEVTSPSPVPPVNILSQVLPPDMYRQLISEINTAITPDDDGDVPLHIAVVHENEVMVKKLIQLMALAGQRVDRYNKQHQTPLHLAVKLSSLSSMKMLMEAGADPNLVDSVGLTSTHMAVQGRDIDCLEALLQWSKYTCQLNNRNFEGLAPLHSAVINNDLEIATHLLDQGADVNIMDGKSGRTALFHAAESNQKAAVELLLGRGADPEIANYAGVVPAMAAQGRSHTTVARLLARALDEGGEEEKPVPAVDKSEHQYRHIPFELMISEDNSRSSHPPVPELRRALSAQVAVQIKQHVAASSVNSPSISSSSFTSSKGQGQGQVTSSSVPSILQSSSVLGNTTIPSTGGITGKDGSTVSQTAREMTGEAASTARPPGTVTKAMHQQLPALITKLTSPSSPGMMPSSSSSSSVTVPRVVALTQRRNSSIDASSVKSESSVFTVDTGEKKGDREGSGGSQAVGSALRTLVTARSLASRQTGGVLPAVVGEEAGDRRVLATAASTAEAMDKRSIVESLVQSSGQIATAGINIPLPTTTTVTMSQKEALARVFYMQMKDIAERQSNGGGVHQGQGGGGGGGAAGGGGVVNVPLIPGVVPLHGLRAATSLTSSSPASGGAASTASSSSLPSGASSSAVTVQGSGVRQPARMGPLLIPPATSISTTSTIGMRRVAATASPALLASLSSPVTTTSSSSITSTTTATTSTPSEAHAQPTRPLLLLRSMWVEPGSGGEGGRRMGSVELRNVTPDALRALQQSSSNLVNQAVGSSPAASNLQQQQLLQSFLTMASARPGGVVIGGGGGGGSGGAVAVETNRAPPVSNHVSRESPQQQQVEQMGYSTMGRVDNQWDEEPKDLSLKSRKKKKEKDSSPPFLPKPELPSSSLTSSGPVQQQDSLGGSRTTHPGDSFSAGNGPTPGGRGGEKKRKAAAGGDDITPKPAKERKAGTKTKSAKSQPAADALNMTERKKGVKGPSGRAVKEMMARSVQGQAAGKLYGSDEITPESKPVIEKPGDSSEGKLVLLNTLQLPTKPALINPETTTSKKEKTTAAVDRSMTLDLGSEKGHSEQRAKFSSDQNDNVKEKLPLGLGPVVETLDSTKIKREVKSTEESVETN